MRLALILSNDWEVFGDGSGDFFVLQETPLRELRAVCANHGAKLTIFAEVGQQLWGFRRAAADDPGCARVAAAWEEGLRAATREGHDVQCHLHPQWLNARRVEDGWILEMAWEATAKVPAERLRAALTEAKAYLEGLIRSVDPAYRCWCYRAGSLALEPSAEPLRMLAQTGFAADSSVAPGWHEDAATDYRDAPARWLPWRAGASAKQISPDGTGLLELPVATRPVWDSAIVRKVLAPGLAWRCLAGAPIARDDLAWQRARHARLGKLYPLARRPSRQTSRWRAVLKRVWRRTVLPLDYDQMPPALFVRHLRESLAGLVAAGESCPVAPIMAMGHTKGCPDGRNLDRILQLARREFGDDLEFWTVRKTLAQWSGGSAVAHSSGHPAPIAG